jgi:hypothetical protein
MFHRVLRSPDLTPTNQIKEKLEPKNRIGKSGQQKRGPTHRQLHFCTNKHQKFNNEI